MTEQLNIAQLHPIIFPSSTFEVYGGIKKQNKTICETTIAFSLKDLCFGTKVLNYNTK